MLLDCSILLALGLCTRFFGSAFVFSASSAFAALFFRGLAAFIVPSTPSGLLASIASSIALKPLSLMLMSANKLLAVAKPLPTPSGTGIDREPLINALGVDLLAPSRGESDCELVVGIATRRSWADVGLIAALSRVSV